jgi:hypothetical protein
MAVTNDVSLGLCGFDYNSILYKFIIIYGKTFLKIEMR